MRSEVPFWFRDPVRAQAWAAILARKAPPRPVKIVHVCGTHENTIAQFGLRSLLPENVQVFEGPGCPVCVTPTQDLNAAIHLALEGAILCTFGDMTRVPGTERTLAQARGEGADVRVVLSAADAVEIARQNPHREVVFFAVGFETTAPGTAAVLLDAPPPNFSVLSSHKLVPPSLEALMEASAQPIDAFLAPGHVSTVIGSRAYEDIARRYRVPVVVAGFEPLDILYALDLTLDLIREGRAEVVNAYPRAVRPEGNVKAREMIGQVFEPVDALWRGVGILPRSGLALREAFARWDARRKFDVHAEAGEDHPPGCRCPEIVMAQAVPTDCPLFRTRCTPQTPVGPCMVGVEGACNVWYRYGGRPQL